MVNWEQVINEMELAELRESASESTTRTSRDFGPPALSGPKWNWIPDPGTVPIVVTPELMEAAMKWQRILGPERFQAELKRLSQEAMDRAFRIPRPPVDNDMR